MNPLNIFKQKMLRACLCFWFACRSFCESFHTPDPPFPVFPGVFAVLPVVKIPRLRVEGRDSAASSALRSSARRSSSAAGLEQFSGRGSIRHRKERSGDPGQLDTSVSVCVARSLDLLVRASRGVWGCTGVGHLGLCR